MGVSSSFGARSLGAVVAATAAILFFPGAAPAAQLGLPGSTFEIDSDANLKVDGPAPAIDWASVSEIRKADTPSGNNDESFGQGTKEDTAVPSVVDGGIPPNKSDLKFFGVYQEGTGGTGFLNMYWSRVQDPSGTTNMDFEFNKRQCTPNLTPADPDCTSNGLTPFRSVGDLLVIYDLSQGGTVPTLSLREWTGLAWGPATNLSASNKAAGSINSSSILAADADGLGGLDPRTFGEAQIDLSAIFDPNVCESFGSVYLKSRSSDSFTAALKDFVPPAPVNIANCGTLNVQKYIDIDEDGVQDANERTTPPVLAADLAGWSFTVTGPGGFSCTGTTDASGVLGNGCTLANLVNGTYTVQENANASKTIGNNGSAFFNTDPGPIPKTPPVSATANVTIGGNTTVDFGNACYATAGFSVTGVPSGTTGIFVRYSVNGGATQDKAMTLTNTTASASVGSLRTGDSITWSFGINNDTSHLQSGGTFSLGAYPSCAGSQSVAFQRATVTALKYKDADADGAQGALEPGLGGFSFELRSGSTVVGTATSGANGSISFSNVAPGTYTIHEVNVPTGWQQTDPAGGGHLNVTINLGDSSVNAGKFGDTPLSAIDVTFRSLGKLPGTTTDATHATSISCKDANGADVGSTTSGNSKTTQDLLLNQSKVTCEITFVDP